MAINKKLIHFNNRKTFDSELANNNILPTSIVFIKDSQEIWTHNEFYATPLPVEEIEAIIADSPTTADLISRITAETTARNAAITTVTTKINDETNRAIDKEGELSAAIAKEIKDRQNAITTEVNDRNTAIAVERNRAVAAEATLQSNIDVNTDSINAEITRATGAENALDAKITNHTDITDSALALKADKSSVYTKEQVDQKVSGSYKVKGSKSFATLPTSGNTVGDVYNITDAFTLNGNSYPAGTNVVYTEDGWDALAGVFDTTALEESIQDVADDLSKEVVRAKEKETALETSIGDTNVALNTEVSRAKKAEQQNTSDITTLAGRVTTNETKLGVVQGDENTTGSINKALKDAKDYTDTTASTLRSELSSTIEGLDATVSGSSANVTVEVTETDGKLVNVSVNQSDIASAKDLSDEVTRATNAESGLDGRLDSVEANYVTTNTTQGISGAKTFSNITISGGLEITGNTPYIDFHHANATSDYTNRIITETNGLAVIGGLTVRGDVYTTQQMTVANRIHCGEIYVDGDIARGNYCDWYGVSWSENSSDPTCTRIGNMAMHRSLPILSAMKGYYIDPYGDSDSIYSEIIVPLVENDWTQVKFSATRLTNLTISDSWGGNIFVKIPEFWYTDDYEPSTKTHNLKISQTAKAGWLHHKEAYVGAYEGYADETSYHSKKGKIPTVSVTREQIRAKARVNDLDGNSKWNMYTYEEHRAICHLFLVEYATRNCQAAVNSTLTADGFRQGGLGSGCTTGTMDGAYSFIPTGTTDSLGNGSGQVAYTASNGTTYYANRYRGIENPFGHIWKHCDDVISIYHDLYQMRTWFKCEDPSQFATNKNSAYKSICSRAVPTKGYKKEIAATINCDFFAESTGGSESTYWCDYNYDNTDTSEHCLLIGGDSGAGGGAGLFYLNSGDGVGHSYATVGSRLTYLPWAK